MSGDADENVKRAYRELDDEPVPRALDARVRAMARAAVATHDVATAGTSGAAEERSNLVDLEARRARRRWVVPASLAATVVLAFGLAQRVYEQSPTGAAAPTNAANPDAESPKSTTYSPPSATPGSAAGARTAPATEPPAPAALAAPPRDALVREPAVGTTAAPSAPPTADAAAARGNASLRIEAAREVAQQEAVRGSTARDTAALASGRMQDSTAGAAAAKAAPSAPAQLPAVPAQPFPAEQRIAPAAAVSAPLEAARERAASPAPAADATRSPERRAKTERTPEEWLADIEALRRDGRTAEADAELARFHAAYPDWHDR